MIDCVVNQLLHKMAFCLSFEHHVLNKTLDEACEIAVDDCVTITYDFDSDLFGRYFIKGISCDIRKLCRAIASSPGYEQQLRKMNQLLSISTKSSYRTLYKLSFENATNILWKFLKFHSLSSVITLFTTNKPLFSQVFGLAFGCFFLGKLVKQSYCERITELANKHALQILCDNGVYPDLFDLMGNSKDFIVSKYKQELQKNRFDFNDFIQSNLREVCKTHFNYEGDISQDETAVQCCICYQQYANYPILTTQCGHYFHFHCILQWSQVNDLCPYCKQTVSPALQDLQITGIISA